MSSSILKLEIISKIQEIARHNNGQAPGIAKFIAETGIKTSLWQGKLWRGWSDALADAGFSPNTLQQPFDDDMLLGYVCEIAKRLGRFPSSGDIKFELNQINDGPKGKTILARWRMGELAEALQSYALRRGEQAVAQLASAYVSRPQKEELEGDQESNGFGYVYMQRHGSDYKIGHTVSLNRRSREIQIELPQEVTLVHSILTDDPQGVEGYWHRRFESQRTRGEWFKLTKSNIAAFKRWSKIW